MLSFVPGGGSPSAPSGAALLPGFCAWVARNDDNDVAALYVAVDVAVA
jgi:hypothetical protein|tara:strand:+ start:130 stop:273 length:144 start_codon:yes stop_codon:yes gene_type:complete